MLLYIQVDLKQNFKVWWNLQGLRRNDIAKEKLLWIEKKKKLFPITFFLLISTEKGQDSLDKYRM